MSIDESTPSPPSPLQQSIPEAPPSADVSPHQDQHHHTRRSNSPPIRVDSPPTSVPYSRLPTPSRQALQRGRINSGSVLMPRTDSEENRQRPASAAAKSEKGKEDVKESERDVNSAHGQREWGEGDFAYEYVPVSQRKEGRQNISYEMSMRQQPVQARMCGVGEKSDRRPVDPTPIIQLKVIDKNGEDVKSTNISDRDDSKRKLRRPEPVQGMSFMQNPYYFLFACLVGGDEKEDELHVIEDGKTRFLTGTPVSSLYHLKDLDNSDAAFFVFPDLGVRKEGRYKLKLTLFEIVEQEVYYCTTMYTSTFSVYSAKKFPGMQSATDLSRSFAEQGLKIRVRKDPRKRNSKIKRKSSANDSEEDMAEFPKRPRHMSSELPVGPDHRHYGPGYPYPPDVYHQHPPNAYPRGAPMPPPPMPHDPYRHPQYAHPGPYPGQPFYQGGPGRPTSSGHHHSVPPPGYYTYPPPPQHSYPPVQHRHHPGHPAPHHDPRTMPPNVPWPQQDRHSRGAPPLPLRSPGLAHSPPPLPSHSAHSHRPHDQIYSPKQQSRPDSADAFRLPPISSTTRTSHESTRSNERGSIVLPIIAGSDPTAQRDQSLSRSSPVVPRAEEGSKGTSTDGSPRSLAGRGANKMGLGHLVD